MIGSPSPIRLSPELEFLESIGERAAPDAVVIVDESGTILFANPQLSHLFGYAPGELHGQTLELLLPQRFRLPHIGHRLRFSDDRRTRPMGAGRGLSILRKDGSECSVQIGLRPVQRGLKTLVVAVIRYVADPSERN